MNQLIEEIETQLRFLNVIIIDTKELLDSIGISEPDKHQLVALSSYSSQFYNGVENILKRILINKRLTMPKGDDWHLQLLNLFSENSKINEIPKLKTDLYDELKNLRRFRHYFIHGYSSLVKWDILKDSIFNLNNLFLDFKIYLNQYY